MGMGEHSIRWLFLSTDSRSNRISMLVFENPVERPVEQGQEPTTNSTHMWYQVPELNLWEERALTTANPTFPIDIYFSCWNCCLVTCLIPTKQSVQPDNVLVLINHSINWSVYQSLPTVNLFIIIIIFRSSAWFTDSSGMGHRWAS